MSNISVVKKHLQKSLGETAACASPDRLLGFRKRFSGGWRVLVEAGSFVDQRISLALVFHCGSAAIGTLWTSPGPGEGGSRKS